MEGEVKERNMFYNKAFSPIFELLLFVVCSALAYSFIFLYERGFADVYSIPPSFITVDLASFAMRSGIIIPIVIVVFWFYWQAGSILAVSVRKNIKIPIWWILLAPSLGLFGYSFYLVLSTNLQLRDYILFGWIVFMPMAFIWLTFIVLPKTIKANTDDNDKYLRSHGMSVLSIVLIPKAKKEMREFLEKGKGVDNEAVWNMSKAHIYSFLLSISKWSPKIVFIFLVVAWSFPCSWLYGRINAYRTEDYLVSSTPSKKVVVLRMYGDKVISVPYIRKDGKIHVKKEFVVFKLGDDDKTKYHSEKIKFLNIKKGQESHLNHK